MEHGNWELKFWQRTPMRFEALTAVLMKIQVLLGCMPCQKANYLFFGEGNASIFTVWPEFSKHIRSQDIIIPSTYNMHCVHKFQGMPVLAKCLIFPEVIELRDFFYMFLHFQMMCDTLVLNENEKPCLVIG